MVHPCAFVASAVWTPEMVDNTSSAIPVDSIRLLKKISYGYISPIVITFGIFGDLMSIMVLSHPVLRSSSVVYIYLLALAATDLCTLLSTIPMILWLQDLKLCTELAAFYYAHVGFPLVNAFMSASVWIVVFFTMAQYMAVCYPFASTFRSKKVCFMLTTTAYCLSAAIYIPWGWRKTVKYVGHIQIFNSCPFEACDNSLVKAATWYEPYQWIRETISRFMPLFLIAYFNIRILFTYSTSKNGRLSAVNARHLVVVQQRNEREERRLWVILLAIMSVFVVCTLPAAAFTIFVSDSKELNMTFQIFRSVANILEFTKFALNFYLYCMINPNIRKLFLSRLLCRQPNVKIPLSRGTRNAHALAALVLLTTNQGKFLQSIRSNTSPVISSRSPQQRHMDMLI